VFFSLYYYYYFNSSLKQVTKEHIFLASHAQGTAHGGSQEEENAPRSDSQTLLHFSVSISRRAFDAGENNARARPNEQPASSTAQDIKKKMLGCVLL
jgi:hypothetical protein